jgi:NAD-dependent SIR2 family protein deacetylase
LLDALQRFVETHERLVVITGAGVSTPSGIGDYRDAQGQWKRAPPIQHDAFVRSATVRQRYWARSFHGWRSFVKAQPNAAHHALASPVVQHRTSGLITQNVDRLHQVAGQNNVIDLHGRLDRVICLSCERYSTRADLQDRLALENAWLGEAEFTPAPDGDADLLLSPEVISSVCVPACQTCGGILKPDVVFYGDTVPRPVVDAAYSMVDASDGVLIVGTSLMVFSSFRFCRRAHQQGIPMLAINDGKTRADDLLEHKIAGRCESILPALAVALRPAVQKSAEP